MFITQKSLQRRTFLRGAGAALALPFLDAMVPALSPMASAAAAPVRRLGSIYIPNGANMTSWTPAGTGTKFKFSPTLSPLSAFRDRLTIVSGLDSHPAEALNVVEGGGDHPRAPGAWLSATHPKRTEGADIEAGVTIDQIVAQKVGKDTPLTSLEIATERSDIVGGCSSFGYSCIYSDTISWRTPTTPLPMDNNPRTVFERLFGDGTNAAQRLAQIREDRSILDTVTREVAGFEKTLGPSDRQRVDEYLDSIRDVERRLQRAEAHNTQLDTALPDKPIGIPDSFEEHCKLMFDLQVLAYQADITRVITFLMGRELSNRTYPEIGVPDAHHALSHHENNPEKLARQAKIDTFHVQLLSYYLGKLRATRDGEGNLLDHTMVMFGAGLSDSNSHCHLALPLLVAGGGAGQVKGGRHLVYPSYNAGKAGTPMGNLLLTLVQKMDVNTETVGDSNGTIDL
jgi:hypothetical protein